jgi:hypothetical protein
VFLVLWVPITAHCLLEKVPGLEFLHCASDTENNSNCQDECQTVESGFYKISDNSAIVPAPVFCMVAYCVIEPVDDLTLRSTWVGALDAVAPDLPRSWQFISRAALPIRAPSLLS